MFSRSYVTSYVLVTWKKREKQDTHGVTRAATHSLKLRRKSLAAAAAAALEKSYLPESLRNHFQ